MSTFSKLLYRFDFLNPHWDNRVGVCLVAIWLLIVLCAISSIRSQGFAPSRQGFWIALVVCVPIAGVLAYLPFSVKRDDLPHYFRFKPRERPVTARVGSKPTKALNTR